MSDPAPPPHASGDILQVTRLSRSFGGLLAVNQVDLAVPRGGILALIGPNGAGKSTTVNLLTGVLPPTTGEIRLEGRDVTNLPSHALAAAGLVRTFQNGRLFQRLSVLENVIVGAGRRQTVGFAGSVLRLPRFRQEERVIRDSALGLLAELGLAQDADRSVHELPYGKQRKLEIARALMMKPKLLMLDEPAAGLNSGEVVDLIDFVAGLRAKGLSILLIEHNMGLVMKLADRITVLNFGKRIASGAPREIVENEAVIEAYLGRRTPHHAAL
jgi:branched-chain amino acid transport system ATP-binding protein